MEQSLHVIKPCCCACVSVLSRSLYECKTIEPGCASAECSDSASWWVITETRTRGRKWLILPITSYNYHRRRYCMGKRDKGHTRIYIPTHRHAQPHMCTHTGTHTSKWAPIHTSKLSMQTHTGNLNAQTHVHARPHTRTHTRLIIIHYLQLPCLFLLRGGLAWECFFTLIKFNLISPRRQYTANDNCV